MIYSIEYCHVYTDKGVDEQAENSITILKDVLKDIREEEFELAVMVDDYTPANCEFSYKQFIEFISARNATPSILIKESSLLLMNEVTLNRMPEGKLKQSYITYISGKGLHPCSLFVATWYLIRLGWIQPGKLETVIDTGFRVADRLINILPVHFLEAENKASKILRSIGVPVSKLITNIYIEDKK